MAVFYRVVERSSNPLVANAPRRHYPQIVTVGQRCDMKFLADKMKDTSSLSAGDIKSVIQNFVEKLKEQLLEGKTVNIDGLGVFMLSAQSKGEEKLEDVSANTITGVRICFQANRELRISKNSTRAGEKLTLIKLDDYMNASDMIPKDESDQSGNGSGNDNGNGDGDGGFVDPAA